MSISSSSSLGGGGGGATLAAGLSAGFPLSAAGAGAGVEAAGALPPPTDPKKSETFFPLSALARALTSAASAWT